MFKNILVANDGSNYGNKSVELAIYLAKKYESKISALYIMDSNSNLSYDELDDFGGDVLDRITAKGKDAGITVIEHIITANPINDMETIIRKINPDLLVIGAYGRSYDENLSESLENGDYSEKEDFSLNIGSVASNALNVSKVPVLLVK